MLLIRYDATVGVFALNKNHTLIAFFKQLIQRIIDNRVPDLSAQLAYYFMLALFPFLIFTVTLLGFYVSTDDVLALIAQYVPSESMQVIEKNLRSVLDSHRGGLLSIGILATLWSSSNATNALIRSLNQAYDVEESRPFWRARAVALMLMFALIGVLLVALLLPVFGKMIGEFIFSLFGLAEAFLAVWNFLRWGISFIIVVLVFIGMYYFAPNKRLRLKDIAVGAVFATVCWQLVSLAFSYFVSQFGNYSATYGGLASVIILMVWFYISGMIMLIGGEINATLDYMRKGKKSK